MTQPLSHVRVINRTNLKTSLFQQLDKPSSSLPGQTVPITYLLSNFPTYLPVYNAAILLLQSIVDVNCILDP